MLDDNSEVPAWIDAVLRKALHPDPYKRYEELSEFVYELRHPNMDQATPPPLLERNPLLFWKCVSLVLALAIVALLYAQHAR